MSLAPFHLAVPVDDLEAAEGFYAGVLGCRTGRRSPRWIDFDFRGHQLVAQLVDSGALPQPPTNPVDGESVPASHFGLVLAWDDWDALQARLTDAGIPYAIAPKTRFAERRGEQRTCFVRDPAGNYLEFKCFRNPEMLFATDGLDYP